MARHFLWRKFLYKSIDMNKTASVVWKRNNEVAGDYWITIRRRRYWEQKALLSQIFKDIRF